MIKIPKRIIAKMVPDGRQLSLRNMIGEAIEGYSQVEYKQTVLLEALLKNPPQVCAIMFKAVQNVRARGSMFSSLIALSRAKNLGQHWKKCSAFLLKLADFRNAIAHWTFSQIVYEQPDGRVFMVPGLHSLGDNDIKPITEEDIADFIRDCDHAQAFLNQFIQLLQNGPLTSQEISQIQPIRPNLAILQSDPTPRAQQPQRPPSKPNPLHKGQKPSAKQKRQRALSKARSPNPS
jgi:hypothetical protein